MSEKVKIKATIPQVTFEAVELEMPSEMFENHSETEMADFIWDNLTCHQRDWCPQGISGFLDALDSGYSTIKKI